MVPSSSTSSSYLAWHIPEPAGDSSLLRLYTAASGQRTYYIVIHLIDFLIALLTQLFSFAQIPIEFAHDVHGHGLNDAVGGDMSAAVLSTPARPAPRGRKPDGVRPNASPPPGAMSAGGGGHERSSSLGRQGRSGMLPGAAAAAAAAAVTAAATGVNGGGHVRSGSQQGLMAQRGLGGQGVDAMKIETDWDAARGPLPSLHSVTGGLRNLHGGRHGSGGQGGGAEVRYHFP